MLTHRVWHTIMYRRNAVGSWYTGNDQVISGLYDDITEYEPRGNTRNVRFEQTVKKLVCSSIIDDPLWLPCPSFCTVHNIENGDEFVKKKRFRKLVDKKSEFQCNHLFEYILFRLQKRFSTHSKIAHSYTIGEEKRRRENINCHPFCVNRCLCENTFFSLIMYKK